MASESCAGCGAVNDEGSSFCSACGQSMAQRIHCPNCNTMNELGRRFCNRCGGSLEHAGWGEPIEPGAVIEGAWERGGDELIRRVDPEDARKFLGSRTVRIPAGTVGVVLVDGVVERVLPPGERTSLSLFSRVGDFFLGRERTAFYLVDQRPFPVPFVVRTRPSSAGQALKTQVLVTFMLPKGDRAALSQFIANVVRDRPSVATHDLYDLLRPDVVRISQEVLERAAAAHDISYPDAEGAIRVALAEAIGKRYGLTVDTTLAPMTAIATATLRLGTGPAPKVRPCVTCKAELPASMRFCDHCGEQQPVMVGAGGPIDAATPLFTADGQQVELDIVARASGQHDDFTPAKMTPAVVSAAAAHLRDQTFATLAGPDGFAKLEQAIAPAVGAALAAFGMALVTISVVDARSKTGQWLLAARADLERAAEDTRLALAWLEQRDSELDVAQLAITRALREQAQRRDQRFAEDAAGVADRERREELAVRSAGLEIAQTQRDAAVGAARDTVDHGRRSAAATRTIELRKAQVEAELAELRSRRDVDLESQEKRKRLELEMERIAEQQQLDKLRAMAELERQASAAEHAQDLEKRAQLRGLTPDEMVAMQATELAKSESGAAWASVLASRADLEQRSAEEQRAIYDKAIGAITDVAKSRAEAAPVVAATTMQVGSAMAAPPHAGPARTCAACGAGVKADAKFCGGCGATV